METAFGTIAPSGPKDTVLLLEDNEIIARLLTTVLQGQGLRVVWRSLGAEGLKEFGQDPHRFALVLSDCRLPDTDGRVICRQIRAQVPDVPVLLTSGRIIPDGLGPLAAERDVHFLPKPYTPSELAARVRAMLGMTAPSRQLTFAGFV